MHIGLGCEPPFAFRAAPLGLQPVEVRQSHRVHAWLYGKLVIGKSPKHSLQREEGHLGVIGDDQFPVVKDRLGDA